MTDLWTYRCRFDGNHDGDTVWLVIDQGFGNTKRTEDGLRLKGVFAPELSQVGGAATRDFVTAWFDEHRAHIGWPFTVRTDANKAGTREIVTFGRYVGTVWDSRGECLNDAVNAYVIAQGFGRGTGWHGA